MAACVCACLGAADNAKMTSGWRKAFAEKSGSLEFESCSARLSGDWHDDTWCLRRAYYADNLGTPQRGKVPGKNDYAEINAGRGRN